MSYEGYNQILCAMGHLTIADTLGPYCLATEADRPKCHCGAEIVWEITVDQTNNKGFPYDAFIIAKEAVYETCRTCGHSERVKEETYKIPTEDEMQLFQNRKDLWDYRRGQ